MHHSSISGLAKPQSHHALGCLLHRFLWFTVNTNFYPSVHLTVQDLQVDAGENPSSLRVQIKTSKTDPFWPGLFHLSRLWSGFSLSYRCNHGLSTPPRVIKGPHFIESTGQPLTRVHSSSFLQSTMAAGGIPGQFSGHSFRIGAAITAGQQSIPDHLINNRYSSRSCTPLGAFGIWRLGALASPNREPLLSPSFDS